MATRHFLSSQEPLSNQVAAFLLGSLDTDTVLVTPTSSAGRQIIQQAGLSEKQSERVIQPMQALLPTTEKIASPVERCLAWASALRGASTDHLQNLFWKKIPKSATELLKAGSNFNRLCDRLAEAGLSPETLKLPDHTNVGSDQGRWSAIELIYKNYISCLNDWKLDDPNALRLKNIQDPSDHIRHVIIACICDLPRAFENYAKRLESNGAKIDILIWNPRELTENHFDAWGRPVLGVWNQREIEIDEAQILVASSALDEASAVARKLPKNNTSLVVIDSKLNTTVASEIRANGCKPYLPEGTSLYRCQAAKIAIEWDNFRLSKDLRSLRRLLEMPAFCKALDIENPLSQSDALLAIDHLLGKTIASHLEAAWVASPQLPQDAPKRERQIRSKVRRLLGLVRSQTERSSLDLIETAFLAETGSDNQAAKRVLEIGRQLEASPALSSWQTTKADERLPVQVLTQGIQNEQIQGAADKDSVTLNGWLEAPWLTGKNLILCGLIEGKLPQSIDGDPFLPDSICSALGLSHNEQRLARDAYLLDALLASRSSDAISLSYSKYNCDGDPNRPSRLLFRTNLKKLPSRVRYLTQPVTSQQTRPRRETNWRWELPTELPKVTKISPTQFASYLSCPFRFCVEKVLRFDSGPTASREMDAAVFGNLIHITLENFGKAIMPTGEQMLRLNEQRIREQVQHLLKEEAARQFGPRPSPAVKIQIANAESRLSAFARVQAECFAEGWIILDVERKLDSDCDNPLMIGPLKLSGIVDRIERHAQTGQLRIMDYKTFSSLKRPGETHFGPISHNWLNDAQIEIIQKGHSKQKTWKNLQLPLYRYILHHWYPRECATSAPATAYFVLPSDPNETGIYTFTELDESDNPEAYDSAISCARSVAQQIANGVFWPLQPFRNSWKDPLAPLLVNGKIEDCLSPETIQRLKGGMS